MMGAQSRAECEKPMDTEGIAVIVFVLCFFSHFVFFFFIHQLN